MPEVWQVIVGLGLGGAETTLHALARALPQAGFSVRVFSLGGDGPVGERLCADGVPVDVLARRREAVGMAWLRLWQRLRQPPDVLQTWLYHADLFGGVAGWLRGVPVVWGVHHVLGAHDALKPATRAVVRMNARLSSRVPAAIVCCSAAALATHQQAGYDGQRLHLIENGVDVQRFAPDAAVGARLRQQLGLPADALIFGHGGRFHPLKAQDLLVRAFMRAFTADENVHLLLWGRGLDAASPLARTWGEHPRLHWLGPREDVPALLNAVDAFVLPSRWEAFPVSVLEAMACATPCMVTAAGAMADMVGETGLVVPVDDEMALAAAMRYFIARPLPARQALGQQARARVVARYSLERMAAQYAHLYRSLL